eukprot:gnl/TRDRNA2_/TRDRNA2_124187_c1_seq1.p1 gnl/TRDRNA2_/TRDRNA2_124187_c1~~gnl/TRDRNA2_/TRDRNA2_124187_c1_seq1.p1  ORF type:complete len:357 (-),score=88.16 gnl/TRDRNA2_/TRDRNA2_124187_c1_seq1:356-1327(-)
MTAAAKKRIVKVGTKKMAPTKTVATAPKMVAKVAAGPKAARNEVAAAKGQADVEGDAATVNEEKRGAKPMDDVEEEGSDEHRAAAGTEARPEVPTTPRSHHGGDSHEVPFSRGAAWKLAAAKTKRKQKTTTRVAAAQAVAAAIKKGSATKKAATKKTATKMAAAASKKVARVAAENRAAAKKVASTAKRAADAKRESATLDAGKVFAKCTEEKSSEEQRAAAGETLPKAEVVDARVTVAPRGACAEDQARAEEILADIFREEDDIVLRQAAEHRMEMPKKDFGSCEGFTEEQRRVVSMNDQLDGLRRASTQPSVQTTAPAGQR